MTGAPNCFSVNHRSEFIFLEDYWTRRLLLFFHTWRCKKATHHRLVRGKTIVILKSFPIQLHILPSCTLFRKLFITWIYKLYILIFSMPRSPIQGPLGSCFFFFYSSLHIFFFLLEFIQLHFEQISNFHYIPCQKFHSSFVCFLKMICFVCLEYVAHWFLWRTPTFHAVRYNKQFFINLLPHTL